MKNCSVFYLFGFEVLFNHSDRVGCQFVCENSVIIVVCVSSWLPTPSPSCSGFPSSSPSTLISCRKERLFSWFPIKTNRSFSEIFYIQKIDCYPPVILTVRVIIMSERDHKHEHVSKKFRGRGSGCHPPPQPPPPGPPGSGSGSGDTVLETLRAIQSQMTLQTARMAELAEKSDVSSLTRKVNGLAASVGAQSADLAGLKQVQDDDRATFNSRIEELESKMQALADCEVSVGVGGAGESLLQGSPSTGEVHAKLEVFAPLACHHSSSDGT